MAHSGSSVADLAVLGRHFDEHRARLLAMLRSRIDPALQARMDPEEILQEAYLAARRKWALPDRDVSMSPYAWLYRIVLDTLIEAWRKQVRECRDLRRDLPWPERSSLQLAAGLLHQGTSPSTVAQRREDAQLVLSVLEGLKPGDRDILWMRHFDELSFAEAASILQVTENAATVRYVRALKRLRDAWNGGQGRRGDA